MDEMSLSPSARIRKDILDVQKGRVEFLKLGKCDGSKNFTRQKIVQVKPLKRTQKFG